MIHFEPRRRWSHSPDSRVLNLGVAAIGVTGGVLVMVMLALTQYLGVR